MVATFNLNEVLVLDNRKARGEGLVKELSDLMDKIQKLSLFLKENEEGKHDLPKEVVGILLEQLKNMKEYSKCLIVRIDECLY